MILTSISYSICNHTFIISIPKDDDNQINCRSIVVNFQLVDIPEIIMSNVCNVFKNKKKYFERSYALKEVIH